jgi:hypothetical protein
MCFGADRLVWIMAGDLGGKAFDAAVAPDPVSGSGGSSRPTRSELGKDATTVARWGVRRAPLPLVMVLSR